MLVSAREPVRLTFPDYYLLCVAREYSQPFCWAYGHPRSQVRRLVDQIPSDPLGVLFKKQVAI